MCDKCGECVRELLAVEEYFGIELNDIPEYDYHLHDVMMEIQTSYEKDTAGNGIEYYAAMYGY